MGRTVGVVTALVVLGLHLPQGAIASVECRYNPSSRLLSVTAEGGSFGEDAVVERVGDTIQVSQLFGPKLSCGEVPTVTNTDRIKALANGFGSVSIILAGGPFAPGATPEADATSEIEFVVQGGGFSEVVGGPGPDHFRFIAEKGGDGLNLNPGPDDKDVDVVLPPLGTSEMLFVAAGEKGGDTIDVLGNPRIDVYAEGGRGDDTLIARGASAAGAILDGGSGRDRLIGSPDLDLIAPGGGPDTVSALGGPDLIQMRADGHRDRINCGRGGDLTGRPDPFDRLRSCELVAG